MKYVITAVHHLVLHGHHVAVVPGTMAVVVNIVRIQIFDSHLHYDSTVTDINVRKSYSL